MGRPGGGLSATGVVVVDNKPEILVKFIADSPNGSHTEWPRKQQLWRGCTREPVRGSADDAVARANGHVMGFLPFAGVPD